MKKKIVAAIFTLSVLGLVGWSLEARAYRGDPNQKAPWFSQERHDAMQKAFDENDYGAWKKIMEEQMNGRQNELSSKITADNFSRFAEMRRLMRDGEYEKANTIKKELGIGYRNGLGKGNCGYRNR